MVHRAAARVSLRSRERKLRRFLDTFDPGPETTVVDVGVTDAPFGAGSSDNFFEAIYPWPERITAVGNTELDRFAAAFPNVDRRPRGRPRAAVRGRRLRPRLLERRDRARRRRPRRPAAVPGRALPRRRARLRDDAEPLVPGRPALAAPVRPLAAARPSPRPFAPGPRLRRRARPARPRTSSRRSSRIPVKIVDRGMTIVAVGPA